ncbi:poly [ADP-ribose] polymerase [Vanessa atalanta]|uniref:poly [ADP-ribose] polymerase n=1 Tax=Vanessa atalanta TaxID=42275 RepID=UPI001FCE14D8|nr:poly [ADP-ribose] polymerase [Vanessa atalanta]
MSDLPYQVEYAKSGRASCKACKNKIDQGVLRIAIMVQSAFHDGKQPNWHHEECFFKKKCPGSIAEIANFNKLKNDDQVRIKSMLGNPSGIVMPAEKNKKGKSNKRDNSEKAALANYSIEYSKSSRATCKHCDIKICKGEIRVSKLSYDPKYGDHPNWHHLNCFAEKKNEFLFLAGGEDLPGFKSLNKEDQKTVKDAIKASKDDEVPVKKLKLEPKDEADIKKEKDLQKKIEKQNKSFHKYRSVLADLTKNDLQDLLEDNLQEVLKGRDECLDHLADIMTFGVPEPCPDCKGQLVLDTFYYKCTGNISEWSKCRYTTKTPKRKTMKVPKAFQDHVIFKKFKSKCSDRIFESEPPPSIVVVKKEEPESSQKDKPVPPLKNLQFFIYGKFKTPKEDIKHRILKLGGLVVNKLTDTLAAVISTKNDLEKMNVKMEEIQDKDIEVVEESFLDLIDPSNGSVTKSLELIRENNIADWGSDPTKRVPQDVIDGKSIQKSGSMYAKSKSTITKLKIKGGTAVDPDSGLEELAHVYQAPDGSKYTAVLSKTDVVAGKNSYYKLQVLRADGKNKFWLFRSWGRIGTPIGGNKVEECKTLNEAIEKFENLYMERTQNPWEERQNFVKMPESYYPIDMDYSDEPAASLQVDKQCSLHMSVQNLIQRIFNIDNMKKTLLEFELDTEKMPLGKLSKKQIKSGYNVLSELLKFIEKGSTSENKIIDATNRFYTLVPHSFGTDNPPLLNTVEIIKNKTEMLDNLLEIEIAYSLLKTESDDGVSPIEAHYRKLKAEITPLDKKSEEFEMILEYVRNTHAATHSSYTLKVQEVFQVVREGEEKRFKPFKKLHNRRLLWHGSRVTNFAGILSQGLRIAPPEAPVTGYMFGKGIYFADMVSKSANYCCTDKRNNVGLLLLSDVALGNMKECRRAENVTKLPSGVHSVWGVGSTQPDPARARRLRDVLVPLGPPAAPAAPLDTSLLYNEFIVYDVAQVNVKYLVQMEFNYTH